MCLYTKNKVPEIAQKDIKVYKVMHVVKPIDGDESDIYGVPPYFSGYFYVRGLNKPSTESKPVEETVAKLYYCDYYAVDEGYLHAFVDWFHAAYRVSCLTDGSHEKDFYNIVEMYIPAGSMYYVGDDGDIAASALYWPDEDKNA